MSGGNASPLGRFRNLLGSRRDGGSTSEISRNDRERLLELAHDYEKSGHGWFWSTSADGRLTYVSECVAQVLGVPVDELVGQPVQSLFILERDEDDGVERTLPLILSARKTFADLPVKAASDSVELWWSIAGRPQFDATGHFMGYYGNAIDVTASRQSHKDASRLAQYDSLTGLANRHRIGKRLNAILTAYKTAKRACAIFMLDLDRFKQVNDTLGHQAGDELLKQVAQRLHRVLGDKSFEIGRLGGDEFQVILPDIDDRGRLGEIALTVISMLSQPYQIDGSRCVIGASVGIAIAPYDGITSEELVRSADLALYASKGGGRGQFRFYSSDLHNEAERRKQIEDDLRDALASDQMHVVYQPIVDATTNKVVSLEALARWEHPELGEIAPSIFIPIAEEASLIGQLGDWVLKQACADAAEWPGGVKISVNVSAAQFGNLGFPTLVAQALAHSGLSPDRLELELTESVFLGDKSSTEDMFNALKMLGVRLALDDFGTGYSSLSYLQHAPFDKIKIDQSFITDVTQPGSRNAAIISAIVSLAKALKMDTTAEGIEAHDELKAMRRLGVSQIQGFIYASAVPVDEVSENLLSGDWVIEPDGPSRYRPDRRTVLRKVGLIHEDHRYEVMMRNLSRSGCMVEGLVDVPVGTPFVVDFGEGQLAVAHVRRSAGAMQGLEFEQQLVDDGAGGLCTRHRVSPYVLAQAGMPLQALPKGQYPMQLMQQPGAPLSLPKFATVEVKHRGVKLG
ncbi:putative bifunctional diguanylate cyclase/phosphodiesterase [Novosphingobium ginsenosidimutans]|uniref:EAL domain-containing protein n=1 Tax=Novosphingobium ginsenosidimutans TaxID=1176536 RepID=A0A5B8S7T6_9SPHN|nr:EAL domain-containing protein [Novosphingobium ginsenosidimutans]QEA16525.1 EAL domain-containing protein [Novosphingobium ginsenosidimutans]